QKRRHYEDGCPARRHVKLASRRPTNARYTMLERTLGYQRSSGESSHRIVSSRCAPVEIRQKGTPISSSSRSRYRRALAGRSASFFAPTVELIQPEISS